MKHLANNNKVVERDHIPFSTYNYKRLDFVKTLKQYQAYTLTYAALGFIASGTTIYHDRTPISNLVHSGINKRAKVPTFRGEHLPREREMSRERAISYLSGKGWRTMEKYEQKAITYFKKHQTPYLKYKPYSVDDTYTHTFLKLLNKLGRLDQYKITSINLT